MGVNTLLRAQLRETAKCSSSVAWDGVAMGKSPPEACCLALNASYVAFKPFLGVGACAS
jgi:hypothetical protein